MMLFWCFLEAKPPKQSSFQNRKTKTIKTPAILEAKLRQEEDWLIGMNGSRAMTLAWRPNGVRGVLSYGGVQMPTLSLLAMREDAIQNFVSTPYYAVTLDVAFENATITFAHKLDSSKHRIEQRAIAEAVKERAMEWSGAVQVSGQEKWVMPPKFFSGNTLAKKCASLFGWRPNETEKVLQGLYDNGYATYPRTESSLLPNEHIQKAPQVLEAIEKAMPDLTEHVPAHANCRKNRHYVPQTGEHHAIVPTDKAPNFASLQEKEQQLYTLLARHFVAAHMEDAHEYHVTLTIHIDYNLFESPQQEFSARGKTMIKPGWKALLRESDADAPLPEIKDGEHGKVISGKVLDKKTEPPRRISLGALPETMARLIDLVRDPEQKKALENPANPKEPKGLGTIASRKQVIETLINRDYCTTKKGAGKDPLIEVTSLGLAVWRRLKEVYPEHASPIARAVFEGNLAEIGKLEKTSAIKAYDASKERTKKEVCSLVHAVTGNPRILDGNLWPSRKPSSSAKRRKKS